MRETTKVVTGAAVGAALIAAAFTVRGCEAPKKPDADENKQPDAVKHDAKPAVATVTDATKAEPQFYEYTVKKGDTLSEISERFYDNWVRYPEIARANGITNPNLIFPDQRLLLRRPVTP